jgi:DNA-directed RNA polymerase I subunit RPA12
MTSIGSLVFCSDCGNLLDENENREDAILKCDVCGALCKDTSQKKIKTESKPTAYPSSLRAKRSEVQQMTEESRPAQATITQTCEKCGRTEVQWYEQQLRGADEGSTIFYICDCGNKYVYNAFLWEITANRFTQMDPEQLIAPMQVGSFVPYALCSRSNQRTVRGFRNQGIISLSALLVFGHIQCNNHTFPYNLF